MSYALRLYTPLNRALPYDNFVAGLVRRRDGANPDLLLPDLDSDEQPDVVLVIRSAGSGGYLSADGFIITAGHVAGLSRDAAHRLPRKETYRARSLLQPVRSRYSALHATTAESDAVR